MQTLIDGPLVRSVRSWPATGLFLLLAACESGPADASIASHEARPAQSPPAVVVDSLLPMPALIERFQAASGNRVGSLAGGAGKAETLVRRYLDALESADTVSLRAMAVSRAEYAYLVFPQGMLSRPPYELNPEIAWLMLNLESEKGVARALRWMRGVATSYRGFECGEIANEGSVQSWKDCHVSLQLEDGMTVEIRLFSELLRAGDQYKFLSYANALPASQAD